MGTDHVHVHGASLAGLAAAIRLARVGHRVSLDPAGPLGGRAHPHPLDEQPGLLVDDLEPVFTLPAAWRDLLKKSGRPLVTELNAHHLELVPAPPAVHRFADGTELVLADDRAGHLQGIREVLGEDAATRWTTLLDQVDELWQALRMAGVERPFPAEPDGRALWQHRTLGQLAQELDEPHLAQLLLSAGTRAGAGDPERAPAWLATRWTLPRTFGRWHLAAAPLDEDEPVAALPMGAMVGVLTDRLVDRQVELEAEPGDARVVIEALAPSPPAEETSWWQRLLHRPADLTAVRPPTVTHDLHPDLAPVTGLAETVFHTNDGVVIAWQRSTPAGVLVTSHDHTHPADPDPGHGWDLSGWRQWVARPAITPAAEAGPWRASAASHAGNEPWAEVLTGALVSYQVHELLTGEDIRPTNKASTPTRRPR
ncbi:hypothetical protein ACPCG0_07820 [Propionibacteriaceae bacterium Y1923]